MRNLKQKDVQNAHPRLPSLGSNLLPIGRIVKVLPEWIKAY